MASSSYLSGLLTATASRYSSLRRTLLSEETDGDTEDDTHICRVLRAYYTEKGRPFPPWLPPDPKAPPPGAPAGTAGGKLAFVSNLGANMWGNNNQGQPPAQQGSYKGSGGGLSDLWDSSGAQAQQPPPSSLRRNAPNRQGAKTDPPEARRPMGGAGLVDSYSPNHSQQASSRPLPSQRFGSYQSSGASDSASPPTTGGTSAQQRLKARLYGGRSTSPTPPNASPAGGGRGGGGGAYDQGSPYDRPSSTMSEPRGRYDKGSTSRSTGSSNQSYGSSQDSPYGSQGGGLPPNPRSGRERGGLPGGPRPYR
ncbi:hypothetical protein P152DRAFT_282262 [Eremomyces bilateralis CBS 781.70]|uniref:Mso1 N-terminal domain-containing protein n=1 Tax=Eremomyces bilateralis CBS 781.70 TaxID=1392243 RepID=A0A6G1G959_9PEZI|nr:uncharacterized protein P152DRAFT_282262 [Eremomyces bilateralis CBS 781.70]KAF1814635.1 hypothetical protein P152DRAFT_282262 [Eremomyces bilateralis CBS 781.70]